MRGTWKEGSFTRNSEIYVLSVPKNRLGNLISGLYPTVKTRQLSFNRTQYKVVTGLFIARNIPRRHFDKMTLTNIPYVGVGQKKKPRATFLCECEALVSFRQTHLGSFHLDPEDVKESKSGGNLGL